MQTQLSNSKVQIQIVENQGQAELAKATKMAEAELARARKQAEQMVVIAEAELARSRKQAEQVVVTAQAESEQKTLAGKGEAARVAQVGLSEASVLLKKIQSFSDPRLYALTQAIGHLMNSKQPLVPQRVFMAGGNGHVSPGDASVPHTDASQGLLGMLLSLLVAEKAGFSPTAGDALHPSADLEQYAEKLAHEADALPKPAPAPAAKPAPVPPIAPAKV
jgi:hypothetical protein